MCDRNAEPMELDLSLYPVKKYDDVHAETLSQAEPSLKALNSVAKRPPVNIQFREVGYTISSYKGERQILHDISGDFRSGELTCILGPSGAGKSTLLNILTGYINSYTSGVIEVNGRIRELSLFKKLSCYIMHDDLMQPRLTALESMRFAADLKLGVCHSKANKELIVTEILKTLRLWKQRNTICERLSGGEAKRLAVALELVNNPPVIFLDEPTTGLDVVSVRQLIVILRLLSRQSRTIICTIHQPAASLFELFDNAYVICEGRCCYQGAPSQLVPFLAESGFICPPTHNPADFVIETLTGEAGAVKKTSALCQNGKVLRKHNNTITRECVQTAFVDAVENSDQTNYFHEVMPTMELSIPFSAQVFILMKRMYFQSKRNMINWIIQFLQYLLCGLFIGGIFFMVGNDGNIPMANFQFCLVVVVFLSYTYTLIPILILPKEIRIIRREYFNCWYGFKAYYVALTCSTIPTAMVFGIMFIIITYFMTGQLHELDRFVLFAIVGLLTGFCSEGLGLVIGSVFNETNGAILGPALISPLLVLGCYGLGFGDKIEPGMKILMSLSYFRHGITGLSLPLLQNRTKMHCTQDICAYGEPALLLRDLGMANDTYLTHILGLLTVTVVHRTVAYFVLRLRLRNEYSNKFFLSIRKCLKF